MRKICVLIVAILASTLPARSPSQAAQTYSSPISVVAGPDGKQLFVAEATAGQVAVFDLATKKVIRRYEVPGPLGGLVLSPDEKLYVAQAIPRGQVHIINLKTADVEEHIAVGHTPQAPVLGPDGKQLFVCNQFDNSVSVIDLLSCKEVATISVTREPVAAAVTPDGQYLGVANLLPVGRADGQYVAAEVSLIHTAEAKVIASIQLPNGSTSLRGICTSPNGAYMYVTHILARYQLPTTQLERGWVNTNAVSIIDIAGRKLLNTVLVDDVDLGAANPWGVACTGDGQSLCIAHAGTHELSVINRAGLHDKLTRAAAGERVSEVSSSAEHVRDDLAFLVDLRQRIRLQGRGPRGLVVVGNNVYLAEYFSDSLGEARLEPDRPPQTQSYAIGVKQDPTPQRRGEMLFHDATMCFQQWQSCASCHPNQARVDGLNWDLLNDGIGNPKNTKSLLLAHETPPAMSAGVRETAEAAVRSGIKHIQIAVRPETDAAAIDAYLKSLQPVPSPRLVDGQLTDSARRGREIFNKAGCGECHPAPLYTDLNSYDVGTGLGLTKDLKLDTPTLIELWRTAPYLHDGRSATLPQLLTDHNPENKHGQTTNLSKTEIQDLVEFLLSQ